MNCFASSKNLTLESNSHSLSKFSRRPPQTLNKDELQTLSSILVGDPLRVAQSLPGAVAHDDARSEFSVRGAGFDRIGLYLDGILAENLFTGLGGGYPDGSLSVINADTVDAVSLMSGAFPDII